MPIGTIDRGQAVCLGGTMSTFTLRAFYDRDFAPTFLHYTAIGQEADDRSLIGLIFADPTWLLGLIFLATRK